MKFLRYIITAITAMALAYSCSGRGSQTTPDTQYTERGAFSADSAFAYVKAQVDFGPRIPGSEAHENCANWIIARLKEFGADTVINFTSQTTAWDGKILPIRNIFARFKPEATTRILLTAHYDTRPWADNDPDPSNHSTPIDGANDGASGVAIIMEIARNLGIEPAQIGVDILFNDCEDYGAGPNSNISDTESTWCIGSQQFAENLPYSIADMPRYGILLDMVGGHNANFNREYFSTRGAQTPTAKVWAMAQKIGLGQRFPMAVGGAITDDHLPLIKAGIPTTDIVESLNPATQSFPPTWHTLSDNINNIDPSTLDAVGRVVLNVIYNETLQQK